LLPLYLSKQDTDSLEGNFKLSGQLIFDNCDNNQAENIGKRMQYSRNKMTIFHFCFSPSFLFIFFFYTITIRIKLHRPSVLIILHPGEIRTHDLLFRWWTRRSQDHAATAQKVHDSNSTVLLGKLASCNFFHLTDLGKKLRRGKNFFFQMSIAEQKRHRREVRPDVAKFRHLGKMLSKFTCMYISSLHFYTLN
jgi:hypothetical protein